MSNENGQSSAPSASRCYAWQHDWVRMPITIGLAKRKVIEYRKCKKCQRGQIRKVIYQSFLNPHGWKFNGE